MNIIALDIDDSILPSDQNYFGNADDSLKMLEINCNRLKVIIDKYDMKIHLTSSWVTILNLKDNCINFKYKRNFPVEYEQLKIMKKYLDGKFISFTNCGSESCRASSIKALVAEGHKVVVIDDMKLEYLSSDNCMFHYTHGFIDNSIGYKLKKFLENKELK